MWKPACGIYKAHVENKLQMCVDREKLIKRTMCDSQNIACVLKNPHVEFFSRMCLQLFDNLDRH